MMGKRYFTTPSAASATMSSSQSEVRQQYLRSDFLYSAHFLNTAAKQALYTMPAGHSDKYDGRLAEAYQKLLAQPTGKSLLRQYLTPEIFRRLSGVKTGPHRAGLLEVISSGVENLDSNLGVYAPHADAYEDFKEIFLPIIRNYHGLPPDIPLQHPQTSFGNPLLLENLDPQGQYVISTRCRVARNLADIPFNASMTRDDYSRLRKSCEEAFAHFRGDLAGTYLPLGKMSNKLKTGMIEDHLLYKEGDRFLSAANALNYWPHGRGIYFNESKTFLVWVGEEDHIRIISMQNGAEISEVVERLVRGLDMLSSRLKFAHSSSLGFLTFCPSNLGTTVRCSVHIKLPLLGADKERLNDLAGKLGLQIRGVHGEHSASEGGIFDVSNAKRLGCTEEAVLKMMHAGCKALIQEEKKLEITSTLRSVAL